MKFSLLLLSLLSMSACAMGPNAAHKKEVAKIPPVKTETVDTPNETTVNVIYQEIKKEPLTKPAASKAPILKADKPVLISVVGQGVAPMNTTSPAQAYALAKRAATADAYRLIAEKVKGVNVDGQDLVKNMMVKRSTVRTSVQAMVKNANIVETTFKDGLCEVEMEITLSHSQFSH
ncbi:LPP20 family lipoprotein [Sulfurimonas sp.]|uniref:LPP20 family lipoprotein n=1 Tax=Sulfurimonas sp. TaxID=2022749 RepID=UPI00261DF32A|nr:LPP20 family lipoprotein [Sulfurimonas sp.]